MNATTQPETKALAQASSTILTDAKALKITSQAEYSGAAEYLKGVKALMKQVDDTFDAHIKRAHDAHKELVNEKKKHQAPLLEAEQCIKRAVLTYQSEQERIRQEAERKAQEAARKEREALEAKAREAERKAAEEAAAKRRAAEEAEAAGRAADAAKLRAQADSKEVAAASKAEALQAQAASVVTPILASNTPKVSGISTRITYKAECTDEMLLADAVAGGRRVARLPHDGPERRRRPSVAVNVIEPNMSVLNGLARTLKESLNYPGVKVVQEQGISSRSA